LVILSFSFSSSTTSSSSTTTITTTSDGIQLDGWATVSRKTHLNEMDRKKTGNGREIT
jgi:hypothetical protein